MKKPKRCLKLNSLPFDISSHPSRELTAVSNIEGEIIFLSLHDDISKLDTITHHTDSCRRILFTDSSLLSISSDKSFVVCDIETKKVQKKYADAHENPLYALCEVREGKVFATGDDEGVNICNLSKYLYLFNLMYFLLSKFSNIFIEFEDALKFKYE